MKIDWKNITTEGLEKSEFPVEQANLRAHEARYFQNKFKADFVVESDNQKDKDYVTNILLKERDITIEAEILETARIVTEEVIFTYAFFQSGLVINVDYSIDNSKKRAVGIKLSKNMEIPTELSDKFKFARKKSAIAGTIRGSFFIIKSEY